MTRLALVLIFLSVTIAPLGAEEKAAAVNAKHGTVVCVSPEAAEVGVQS